MELNLITSKDDLRPTLNYVKVTKENCVATDAHALGVIPTEDIFDEEFIIEIPEEGMLIHSEDWKKLKNNINVSWKTDGVIKIMYKGKKRDVLIETEREESIGIYPKWESVIPKEVGEEPVESIGINFKIGLNLQKALGSENGLKASFYGRSKAIRLDTLDEDDNSYGILMPVKI